MVNKPTMPMLLIGLDWYTYILRGVVEGKYSKDELAELFIIIDRFITDIKEKQLLLQTKGGKK